MTWTHWKYNAISCNSHAINSIFDASTVWCYFDWVRSRSSLLNCIAPHKLPLSWIILLNISTIYNLHKCTVQFMNQKNSANSFLKSNYSLHISMRWAHIKKCKFYQNSFVSVLLLPDVPGVKSGFLKYTALSKFWLDVKKVYKKILLFIKLTVRLYFQKLIFSCNFFFKPFSAVPEMTFW